MRKTVYDELCKEALERLSNIPVEQASAEVNGIREALKIVLLEEDETKLEQYYKNIDEFYAVNAGKGLEYMNGDYLIRGV